MHVLRPKSSRAVCFFETGVIGAVWIRWIYFQSSAARRSVGVSPSLSRFCSFFGSWSRTQCGPAPHFPPHPRLFSLLVKTGFVAMVMTECAILGMAVERRHKLLSFLGMVGEERHKALLVLVFNVYFTGSELSALPVTPSEGPSQGVWMSAEAYRVVRCGAEPKAIQLVIFKCIRGVLAVHSSERKSQRSPRK